jgi:hypothetical protein
MKSCAGSIRAMHQPNRAGQGGSIPAPALCDRIEEVEAHAELFPDPVSILPIYGAKLVACKRVIETHHYTRSVPSGKSHYFYVRGVIVCFSIPANKNIGRFLLKRECVCWELARLWAKDGHSRNALTRAIAVAAVALKRVEPDVEVLVSFADPNAGHEGHVYRAASWVYAGRSEEVRAYLKDGQTYPRRRFHSGDRCMTKAEIEARGYRQVSRIGKIRFAKGMTSSARRQLRKTWPASDQKEFPKNTTNCC